MDHVSPVRQSIRQSIPTTQTTSMTSLVAKMTNRHQLTNRLLRQAADTAENTPPSTSSQNSASLLQPPPPSYRKKKKVKLQPLGARLPQCPQPDTVPPNQSCEVSDGIIHRHGILPPITVDGVTTDCECGSDRTAGELSGYSSANDIRSDFTESDVTIDFLSASASNESLLDQSISQQGHRPDEDENRHVCNSPFPLCPPNSVSGSLCTDSQIQIHCLDKTEGLTEETQQEYDLNGENIAEEDNSCSRSGSNQRAVPSNLDRHQIDHQSVQTNISCSSTRCNGSSTKGQNFGESKDCASHHKKNSAQQSKSRSCVEMSNGSDSEKGKASLPQNNSCNLTNKVNNKKKFIPGSTPATNQEVPVTLKDKKCQNKASNQNKIENQSEKFHVQNMDGDVPFHKGYGQTAEARFGKDYTEKNPQKLDEMLDGRTCDPVPQPPGPEKLKNSESQTSSEELCETGGLNHLRVDAQTGRPLARVSPNRHFGPIPEGNGNLVVTRFSENQKFHQVGLSALPLPPELHRLLQINQGNTVPVQQTNPAVTSDPISQCLQHLRTCHYAVLCPPMENNKRVLHQRGNAGCKNNGQSKNLPKDKAQTVNNQHSSCQPEVESVSVQGIQMKQPDSKCHISQAAVKQSENSENTFNAPKKTGTGKQANKKVAKNSSNLRQQNLSERNISGKVQFKRKVHQNLKVRQTNDLLLTEKIQPITKSVNTPKKQAPPPWRYTGPGSGIPPLRDTSNNAFVSPRNINVVTEPKRRYPLSNSKDKQVNKGSSVQVSKHKKEPRKKPGKLQKIDISFKPDLGTKTNCNKPLSSSSTISENHNENGCDKMHQNAIHEPHSANTDSHHEKDLKKLVDNENANHRESICSLLRKLRSDTGSSANANTSDGVRVDNAAMLDSGIDLNSVADASETDIVDQNHHIEGDSNSQNGLCNRVESPTEQVCPCTGSSTSGTCSVSEGSACRRLPFQKSPIILSANLMVVPMSEAPRVHMVQPGTITLEGQAIPGIRMILPTPLPPDLDGD